MIFLLVVGLMAVPVVSFAQARNASGGTLTQTRTNLSNLMVTGLNVVGNPGFLGLTGVQMAENYDAIEWFLWVDTEIDLCMASAPTLENYSVFPNGDWGDPPSSVCTKVGDQS